MGLCRHQPNVTDVGLRTFGLDKQCADEGEDGIELGEGGVDEGLCHHVVTLSNTLDTSCADLTLTDS